MQEFHEISGHKAWHTSSGTHHVQVKLPAAVHDAADDDEHALSVHRMITFSYALPFWTRVKVLLGWNLVVKHTAIDGLTVSVGTVVPPVWWPIDSLVEAEKAPCK